jgi:hypothetical protein
MADLPPFLRASDPLELEQVPLQVALLTMEVASLRLLLGDLMDAMAAVKALLITANGDGTSDTRANGG